MWMTLTLAMALNAATAKDSSLTIANDRLHESWRWTPGITVTEYDNVFQVGRRFLERLMRQLEDVLEAAQIALVHPGDLRR